MILSFVRQHLSVKISLLLVPLILAGLGGFAWFLIDSRAAVVEDENFRRAKTAAIVGAEGMSHILEELVNSGVFSKEEIFDQDYQKITGGELADTKIPKYHTRYDQYLDGLIKHFQDAFLSDESIVFAVLVDTNGYLPTHNSRYSQPLTGDDDKDQTGNRTKRIFNDPVGLKAARFERTSGQAVLRQTYHRDTGVTMWDVSAPVIVFGRHWGGFRIGLSMERAEAEVLRLKRTIIYASSGFGFLTVLLIVGVVRRATIPLKRLTLATRAIADGQHQEQIELQSQDEIGELVNSFNQMQRSLENTTVSRDFFDRIVNSIHDLLLVVSPTGEIQRINKAVLNVLSSDESKLLGTNVNELFDDKAGGKNWAKQLQQKNQLDAEDVFLLRQSGKALAMSMSASPLYSEHSQVDGYIIICQDNDRRIRAELEMEKAFDNAFALNAELRDMNDSVEKKNQELDDAYRKLKASQSQILQQEKMASIGQLAAGVAHEINNPMGFITSNLQTLGKYIDRLNLFINEQKLVLNEKAASDELQLLQEQQKKLKVDYILADGRELIEESLDGAGRVKKIVQNLKSFSRVDLAEMAEVCLNDCLESTISIAWNELKYKSELEKDFGELAPIPCHPQQLNQVFLNILINAAQAIEKQGTIRISTRQDENNQYVSISDDGSGIPEDIQKKIFEPFFTTKDVGKGTGLGMSISYDIIHSHGGRIDLESEIGIGTTFTIVLPRHAVGDLEKLDG